MTIATQWIRCQTTMTTTSVGTINRSTSAISRSSTERANLPAAAWQAQRGGDNGSKAMSMRQPAIEGAQMYPRSDDEDGYKSDDERESLSNRGGTDYTFGETDAGHGSGHESLSSFPQDLVPSLSVTPPNQLVLKNSRKTRNPPRKCNGNDSNGGSGQVGAGGRGRGRNSPSSSLHVSEKVSFRCHRGLTERE